MGICSFSGCLSDSKVNYKQRTINKNEQKRAEYYYSEGSGVKDKLAGYRVDTLAKENGGNITFPLGGNRKDLALQPAQHVSGSNDLIPALTRPEEEDFLSSPVVCIRGKGGESDGMINVENIANKMKEFEKYQKRFAALERDVNQIKINSSMEGEKVERLIKQINHGLPSDIKNQNRLVPEACDTDRASKNQLSLSRLNMFSMQSDGNHRGHSCKSCGSLNNTKQSLEGKCEDCKAFMFLPRIKKEMYRFDSGAVYSGEWRDNLRDGRGAQFWPDGSKYDGQWAFDKANGIGTFTSPEGDSFEGEWFDNRIEGVGVFIVRNVMKCEGYWKNNMMNGYGVQIWNDGSSYRGVLSNGNKHGKGIYEWSDGSTYDGDWNMNKMSGNGSFSWVDGRKYNGEWLDNNMNGRGVYVWKDGSKYEGEFFRGKKHGFGTYLWKNGKIYEGFWENGKQHGEGKLIYSNGRVKEYLWNQGKKTFKHST